MQMITAPNEAEIRDRGVIRDVPGVLDDSEDRE